MRQEIMKEIINVDSVLETKASGCLDVSDDLNLPEGKSIAQLLYEQEEEKENNESTQ